MSLIKINPERRHDRRLTDVEHTLYGDLYGDLVDLKRALIDLIDKSDRQITDLSN